MINIFIETLQENNPFSDVLNAELHPQQINQVIIEKRDEHTGKHLFLVIDNSEEINQLLWEFSEVILKESKLKKSTPLNNEYAISFQQLSETHNLYTDHDLARFKDTTFRMKENDFIAIINVLYTAEDWLDHDQYLDYYTK